MSVKCNINIPVHYNASHQHACLVDLFTQILLSQYVLRKIPGGLLCIQLSHFDHVEQLPLIQY